MKLMRLLFLICLFLLAGCSTPTPDVQFIATSVAQTVAAGNATPTLNLPTQVALTVAARPTDLQQPTQQQPQPTASDTPGVVLGTEATATPAPTATTGISEPKIEFTYVPPIGSADYLSGVVTGINPDDYAVAVYIRVAGGWWTKPYFDSPKTEISSDGTWSCPYVTGGNDANADTIRAYLIPKTSNPPMMQGGPRLPSQLEDMAVAHVEATRK